MTKRIIINKFKHIKSPVLAAISGLLIVLALPPFPFYFLAFIALVPFIYILIRNNFFLCFSTGFVFGLILNLGILYWLAGNQGTTWYFAFLSMLGAVLILAVQYGILGITIGFIGRRLGKEILLWSLPVLFGAFEFITAQGVLGFTWNSLCYTQTSNIIPAQIASIFGCYGISFWIVLVNVLLYKVASNFFKRKKVVGTIIILTIVILLPYLYGFLDLNSNHHNANGNKITVGLVQPNVDPNEKWNHAAFRENMNTLYALSDSVTAQENLDLLVWPETAIPAYLRYRKWLHREIHEYISQKEVSLLTGAPDFVKLDSNNYNFYNSTFFMTAAKTKIESYNKIRLVPFGEKIPLSNIFEVLENINLGQGNFDAGDSIKLFEVPLKNNDNLKSRKNVLVSSAICYESGFSDLVRGGVRKGAQLLVIVTNDAWFGNTSAPYLHAAIAKLRAIENNIPIVRAANTGVSTIIDSRGRTVKKCGFEQRGYATSQLNLRSKRTIFSRMGYYFNYLLVGISIILLGFCYISPGSNRKKEELL
ncbi:MAG: apolipoprotein N-acyltransferase [Candidatus Marinimicrobia bacterium]|nr:apolipoprotein N-acyltransferase [Candidatus Neomarinimicrobiota bacterium]